MILHDSISCASTFGCNLHRILLSQDPLEQFEKSSGKILVKKARWCYNVGIRKTLSGRWLCVILPGMAAS